MKKSIALSCAAGLLLVAACFVVFHFGSRYHDRKMETAYQRNNWRSSETPAAGSMEGRLRAQGKTWVKTSDAITVGAYVQDTLEGRMGQPKGRGAIGKVLAVSTGTNGPPAATVDFGRGSTPGINFSELSVVMINSK